MTGPASDSLVDQVEGKTLCDRVRYRLQRVGVDMTANGLRENLGASIPQQQVLFALDAFVAHGHVIRRQDGPRPVYRWNPEKEFTDGSRQRVDRAFRDKVEAVPGHTPEPAPGPILSTESDPLQAAADAALARASATAKAPAVPHKTHRASILELFEKEEAISRKAILEALPHIKAAVIDTTISTMIARQELARLSPGILAKPRANQTMDEQLKRAPKTPKEDVAPPRIEAPQAPMKTPMSGEVMIGALDLDEPGLFAGAVTAALRLGHKVNLKQAPGGEVHAYAEPMRA